MTFERMKRPYLLKGDLGGLPNRISKNYRFRVRRGLIEFCQQFP